MKYPSAWSKENSQKVSSNTKKVEARIDMSAEVAGVGKCPECKTPMKVVKVGGKSMWVCSADRITLPLPDGYGEKV